MNLQFLQSRALFADFLDDASERILSWSTKDISTPSRIYDGFLGSITVYIRMEIMAYLVMVFGDGKSSITDRRCAAPEGGGPMRKE